MDTQKLPTEPSDPFENASAFSDIHTFELVPSTESVNVGDNITVNVRCSLTDGSTMEWMLIPIISGNLSVLRPANDWQFCRTFSAESAGSTTLTATITDRFDNPRTASATITVEGKPATVEDSDA